MNSVSPADFASVVAALEHLTHHVEALSMSHDRMLRRVLALEREARWRRIDAAERIGAGEDD